MASTSDVQTTGILRAGGIDGTPGLLPVEPPVSLAHLPREVLEATLHKARHHTPHLLAMSCGSAVWLLRRAHQIGCSQSSSCAALDVRAMSQSVTEINSLRQKLAGERDLRYRETPTPCYCLQSVVILRCCCRDPQAEHGPNVFAVSLQVP